MASVPSFTIDVVRGWLEGDVFHAVLRVTAHEAAPVEVDLRVQPVAAGVTVEFLGQTVPDTATPTKRQGLGLTNYYPTGQWQDETREYHLRLRVPSTRHGRTLAWVSVIAGDFQPLAQVYVGTGPDAASDGDTRGMATHAAPPDERRPAPPQSGSGAGWVSRGSSGEDEHRHPGFLVDDDPDNVFGKDGVTAPPVIGEDWPREPAHAEATPPTTTPGGRAPADGEHVVNTGFAEADEIARPLPRDTTLSVGRQYLFWLDLGPRSAATIETAPAPLPTQLPPDAIITVALFGFPDGLGVDPANAVAFLRMRPDRTASPIFLPVTTPAHPGAARLRCNLYWRQVLLQSRVVTAHVTATPTNRPDALSSTMDYRLADPADLGQLAELPAHTASIQLNDDSGGTHALRIVAHDGRELLRAEATLAEGQLTNQIQLARGALRRVAWGDDEPWRPGKSYRYRHQPPIGQLAGDLALLAVNGYRLHHLLLRGMGRGAGTGAYAMGDRLANALRNPGYVQIALKESAQHVLPAALLYDLPLDTNATRLTLCPDFFADLTHGRPLSCVRGACRQAARPSPEVVCPGGFWGFRHALGLPVSLGGAAGVPVTLPVRAPMLATAGLYRDFQQVDDHCAVLRHLLPGMGWRLTENRADTLHELSTSEPQVVYFYCHGGVAGTVPYLRVGRGNTDPVITPDNLYHARVHWPRSRPLVFLNGCRTTDLDPDRAIDFVSFFVEDAQACGVIGTEITVFEELARPFAEDCLRRFLTAGVPIGTAVRDARISLLNQGNPLGLAYIPFVLPAIRIPAERSLA
ncbi:hypothetical protein [Actinophytocola sp.]|uniref:hypothetical protein n=1 Tax=Actinophytocola sp. TaxID=1872138 RepID=UPI002D26E06F|nr:hypothetical protein [Actinophytocola sp.]HYQ70227.1 hypothetical protein [Actinophytocola sp.]